MNAQHRLDLVQQVDRILAFAVELVDEAHDRRVAQPADLHQLDGALFHALGDVDHHQGRIDRGQHAIGVLTEIGMARGVEQIDDAALVGELHHRTGDRNAALLFQRHPVRGRMAGRLAALDRAGHLDRSAEQQQLFGQGGLARIGVGNDGESAAAPGFAQMIRHGIYNEQPRSVPKGANFSLVGPVPGQGAGKAAASQLVSVGYQTISLHPHKAIDMREWPG